MENVSTTCNLRMCHGAATRDPLQSFMVKGLLLTFLKYLKS
jgi:hypothetical protein